MEISLMLLLLKEDIMELYNNKKFNVVFVKVGGFPPLPNDSRKTDYHFFIPLPKVVDSGLEASISGNFTIDGVLSSAALSTMKSSEIFVGARTLLLWVNRAKHPVGR